jgi:hypothetical protein
VTSFEALRRRPAGLTALILCIGLAGTAACYWLRYHDLVRTHASLMSRMASDAQAQLAQGVRPLTPSDIERLRYPLERARQFMDVSRSSREGSDSFRGLEGLADRYEVFVDELDRARVEEVDASVVESFRIRLDGIESQAASVRSACDLETQ